MAQILGRLYDDNLEEAYLSMARRDMRAFRSAAAKLGIVVFQRMDATKTLALITEANLGVNQQRVIKRFFFEHVGSSVLQTNSLLNEEKKSQNLALKDLEFGEMELKSKDGKSTTVAIGRVTSIRSVVERDLDVNVHFEHGLGESVPKGATLVSIMDDGGGGSEKIAFALRSLESPCSTNHVSLLVLSEGDDKAESKRLIAGDLFKEFGELPESSAYCVSFTGPSADDKSTASAKTRHKVLRPDMKFTMCVNFDHTTINLLENRQLGRQSDTQLLGVPVLVAREAVGEDDDGELLGFAVLLPVPTFQTTSSVWDDLDEEELFDGDDDDDDVRDGVAQQRARLKAVKKKVVEALPPEEVWPGVWQLIFSYVGVDGSLSVGASFKLLKVADATETVYPVQREAPASLDRLRCLVELASGAATGLENALNVRTLEGQEARRSRVSRDGVLAGASAAMRVADGACPLLDGAAKRKATGVARVARAAFKTAKTESEAALKAQESAKEMLEGTRRAIERARFVVHQRQADSKLGS